MKKIMIFAAFAALVSLASCQKEALNNNGTDQKSSPVFTASIAGSTKTTIDVSDGKVSWEEDDEITVSDASKASAVYEIESIDANTGKATFVIKTGETPLGAGPYTATYGTAPEWEQTYTETPGQLYMTAQSETTSLKFTVQCGLMELNLTKGEEAVNCIAVTGTTYGEVQYNETFTLNCDVESIDEGKSFYIALPAGNYYEIVITDNENKVCTLESEGGVEVLANHIKPVTLPAGKLNFKSPAIPSATMDADKKPSLGKESVTSIVIETDATDLPTDEEEDYILKMNNDGTIWQILDGETLYIKTSATDEIKLPQDASKLFQDYLSVTEITGLDNLNTSEVRDVSYMFSRCEALESLDLSGFNTENVENMSYMFSWCESMGSLTLPLDFNTENATTMSYMFSGCLSLGELDLSSFNTGFVIEMSNMFSNCNSLQELNLSSFNTENVMNMASMFSDCSNLGELDLSSFNTTSVTNMSSMFNFCTNMAKLKLSEGFVIPEENESIFSETGVYNEIYNDEHCHVIGEITDATKTIIEGYDNMTIGGEEE